MMEARTAVFEMLKEKINAFEYDPSSATIRFIWTETGVPQEWRLTSPGALQRDAMLVVGNMGEFARQAHHYAKPGDVLACLQQMVLGAKIVVEPADPERLMLALLHAPIWVMRTAEDGHPYRSQTSLIAHPGDYIVSGLALRREGDRWSLYVNVDAALQHVLHHSPEFGRRTTPWLSRRLKNYRGHVSDRVRTIPFRRGRWHELDVTEVMTGADTEQPEGTAAAASPDARAAESGTEGTDSLSSESVPRFPESQTAWSDAEKGTEITAQECVPTVPNDIPDMDDVLVLASDMSTCHHTLDLMERFPEIGTGLETTTAYASFLEDVGSTVDERASAWAAVAAALAALAAANEITVAAS